MARVSREESMFNSRGKLRMALEAITEEMPPQRASHLLRIAILLV